MKPLSTAQPLASARRADRQSARLAPHPLVRSETSDDELLPSHATLQVLWPLVQVSRCFSRPNQRNEVVDRCEAKQIAFGNFRHGEPGLSVQTAAARRLRSARVRCFSSGVGVNSEAAKSVTPAAAITPRASSTSASLPTRPSSPGSLTPSRSNMA